jgi:hypothetical protein
VNTLRNIGWGRLPWWPGEKKLLAEAEARVDAALGAAEKTYTRSEVDDMLSDVILELETKAGWAAEAARWQERHDNHQSMPIYSRMYGETVGRSDALREAADQLRELRGLLQ